MIRSEVQEQVAIITLDRSVSNAINMELVTQLNEAIQSAKKDDAVRGVVLTSASEKFFCIGFDVPELFGLSKEDFTTFFRAYNHMALDLYTLPKPTAVAIGGHAIAGGCILALCCDYRFIGEGRKLMGVNEVPLGVPVPYLADCIMRDLVGVRYAREIMELGDLYPPDQLLAMGLVDTVCPSYEVLAQTVERVQRLAGMPAAAYRMTKQNRVGVIEALAKAHLDEKMAYFIDCWYADEARANLEEAIKKF